MSVLDYGLTAVAVLLFLFGVRSLLSKQGGTGLGCSYGIACGFICSWLFKDELGGIGNGLRLGLGIVLLMPAIKALAKPEGKNIIFAAVALLVGFLVAGGPVTTLAERYVPGLESGEQRQVEEQLVEIEGLRERLGKHVAVLEDKEAQLRIAIKALGSDKESILAHPDAGQKLAQLEKTKELLAERRRKITQLDDASAMLQLRLEQLQSGAAASAIADDPELEALLNTVDSAESPEDLGLLEGTLKLEELEELYESEF